MHSRKTGLFIALGTCAACFVIVIIFASLIASLSDDPSLSSSSSATYSSFSSDQRIDILPIEGEITSASAQWGGSTYNHQAILDTLDTLIEDEDSKGLILFLDTPGGGIYETDEVYLKLLEYKASGRPIYASMGSITASGGYYLASAADYIVCNRNTLTGSIGVIMPSYIDLSEFLSQHGIKVYTPKAGANKAMGSPYAPVTQEQIAIISSVLGEAHEQFMAVVSEGRHLDMATVKKLADGRIYSAKQALHNGLVDSIGTLDDTILLMQEQYDLQDAEVNTITLEDAYGGSNLFFQAFKLLGLTQTLGKATELETALSLQQTMGKFGYYYSGALLK